VRLARLRGSSLPSRAHVAASACAALALIAALAGGDLADRALRAGAVVAFLAVAAFTVRGRGGPTLRASTLVVEERHALARDAGIALVCAGSCRLVVGYGTGGVRLLARFQAPTADGRP
jgi:hypothetical protein